MTSFFEYKRKLHFMIKKQRGKFLVQKMKSYDEKNIRTYWSSLELKVHQFQK